MRQKPGGVKTNALVALASCAFVLVIDSIDPTQKGRVITGIIQGVGFIGGGLILKEGHTARGITGAAEIWVAAAIGLACSVAMWGLAITILGLAILILLALRWSFPKEN